MSENNFSIPKSSQHVEFTGERYMPGISGRIRTEHVHRYLFALQFVTGRDVLDVACSEGYGSYVLGQAARSVVDVDTADVVRLVCERAVWLDHGTMLADGPVDKVLDAYGASLQLLS